MTMTSDTGWRLNSTQCIITRLGDPLGTEFVTAEAETKTHVYWGACENRQLLLSLLLSSFWLFMRTWPPGEEVPGSRQPAWWPLWMEPGPASSECSRKNTRSMMIYVTLNLGLGVGVRFLQRHKSLLKERKSWFTAFEHKGTEKAWPWADWNAWGWTEGWFLILSDQ